MGEPVAGSAVDEIKERLEIADVVAAYVPLKQSGRSMKGLCPFHGEKTPSFYVFPETGTWKCFGCGEGGDVFTFVQKQENIDFVDALRLLAARSGVELPSRDQRAPEDRALEDRLRDTLLVAERYFQAALKGLVGASARAYLDRRGITDAGVERFSLGYAPASGLLRHLLEHGHTADEAAEVGLAGSREDGSRFEMFRERLMFPIRDPSGRTIAFGGRTLGDGQPKYLNGPQTRFFDKSGCLFALDLARPAIRKSGQAVIVEGYLDALIAHQYGYDNVVATLGTALTGRHLELLGKADQIVLALDADAAGQAATLRGLQVVQDAPGDTVVPVPVPGVRGLLRYQAVRKSEVRVLTLPAGLDPDDLIRKDPTEWGRLVGAATPVVDFVLNRLGERFDLASPRGKQDAVQEAMSIFRDLTDPIVREHYLQRLAAIVGVDESGLRAAIRQLRPRSLAQRAEAQVAQSRPFPEAYAIALHLLLPAADSSLVANDCSSAEARAVLAMVDDLPIEQRTAESLQSLVESAEPALRPGLSRVLDWLSAVEKLSPEQRARELEVAVLKLRQQLLKLQHQQVLVLLAEPDAQGSPSTPVSMLTSIAAQLREIESALAARDGVGSLVWRSRQLGEVFGG